MKLYHCKSARSLRALWTLEELGLDYELEVLPFPPRAFKREFLEINPLGTVPYFVDGDTHMSESVAICQYLVDRYGDGSLSVDKDHADYGAYLNWLHRADATLTFPQTIALRYSVLEPEERRVPQVAEDYRTWFIKRFSCVEEALADRDYLVAGRFTIADIAIGYVICLAKQLRIGEIMTPAVTAYWQRLSDRPAFQRADARE